MASRLQPGIPNAVPLLTDAIDPTCCANNSVQEILYRVGIKTVVSSVNITGNNDSYNTNVFLLAGAVTVLEQYAVITAVTDLTNMTDVYADLWDGTNSVPLTKTPGLDLSGYSVGSFFTKDEVATSTYSSMNADQCRMLEAGFRTAGRPFTVNAKNGANTYIRFNYTTNTTLDFTMDIYFYHRVLDSGSLTLV